MTDGPILRLAKAAREVGPDPALVAPVRAAVKALAGPCGMCPRSCGSVEDTEGEWHLCPDCNGTGSDPLAMAREADRVQFVDPESPDYELEVSRVIDAYDATTDADCRLIAAAPNLLAAIEGLMEIAQMAMPDAYFASDSRVAKARAAIAKATGEN